MSQCKGCNAEIIWVKMQGSSKAMPLDAKPEKRIIITSLGEGIIVNTYVSHFATCPKADQFRKEKK